MPRHGRFLEGDGPLHLTARGTNRKAIFLDEHDNRAFIHGLGRTCRAHGWSCLAYCLMVNHVHLVIAGDSDGISRGMKSLLGGYAQRFNKRHAQSGHVFGDRFHHVRVDDDRQLHALIRYVALNPVRAGLVDHPEGWPWSSHASVMRGVAPPDALDVTALLALFPAPPGHPDRARGALQQLVAGGLADALAEASRRVAATQWQRGVRSAAGPTGATGEDLLRMLVGHAEQCANVTHAQPGIAQAARGIRHGLS